MRVAAVQLSFILRPFEADTELVADVMDVTSSCRDENHLSKKVGKMFIFVSELDIVSWRSIDINPLLDPASCGYPTNLSISMKTRIMSVDMNQ